MNVRTVRIFLAVFLLLGLFTTTAVAHHNPTHVPGVCDKNPDHHLCAQPSESPSPSPTDDGHSPPSSIAADCSVDVTAELQEWLDSLPDGQSDAPTRILFADACYRIDGSLLLIERQHLHLSGGTFRAITDGAEWQESNGWRTQWRMNESHHLTFTDMIVEGTNYDGEGFGAAPIDSEGQHNWTVKRTNSHITFDGVTGRYPWGDGICLCNGGLGASPITDITIVNSTFQNAGRHGVALNFGERLVVDNNHFDQMSYAMDLEVEGSDWYIRDVEFTNNTMGAHRFHMLVAAVDDLPVTDVLVEGNEMLVVGNTCRGPIHSSSVDNDRWTVRDNVFRTRWTGVVLKGGDDHLVESNIMHAEQTNCSAPTYGLNGTDSTGIYRNNVLHDFDYLGSGLDGWQVSNNEIQ